MKQSFNIGHLTLKNRLVMPPMATRAATQKGGVTPEIMAHYEARIKSGLIGLAVAEHAFVLPAGRASEKMMSVASDDMVEGLTELTALFHRYDTPVFAQLNHAGCATTKEITGEEVVGAGTCDLPPETLKKAAAHAVPRMLRTDELPALKDAFVQAALRAKKAGFDGVVIHCAHAYLLNQFYSPLTNDRTDEYGGDVKARIRLTAEIVGAVREATGKAYPISVRLGACDHMEGGNTVADAVEAAKCLEQAGADLLDISGGMCRYTVEGEDAPGTFRRESHAIRDAVSLPVLLTGGVTLLSQGEALLKAGDADLIGVGRALLKDPDWAVKQF